MVLGTASCESMARSAAAAALVVVLARCWLVGRGAARGSGWGTEELRDATRPEVFAWVERVAGLKAELVYRADGSTRFDAVMLLVWDTLRPLTCNAIGSLLDSCVTHQQGCDTPMDQ